MRQSGGRDYKGCKSASSSSDRTSKILMQDNVVVEMRGKAKGDLTMVFCFRCGIPLTTKYLGLWYPGCGFLCLECSKDKKLNGSVKCPGKSNSGIESGQRAKILSEDRKIR